jgi:hypothetical protein
VLSITCGLIAFILVQRATNLLLDSSFDPNTPIVATVSTGAGVKQRIQRTVVVVFSGFLIRSSFDLLYWLDVKHIWIQFIFTNAWCFQHN